MYACSFVRQDKYRGGEKSRSKAIDSWPVSDLRELGLNTVLFFRFHVIFKHLPYKCPNAVTFLILTFFGFAVDGNSEWEKNCERSKLSFCCTVRPAERPIMQQVSRDNNPMVIIKINNKHHR